MLSFSLGSRVLLLRQVQRSAGLKDHYGLLSTIPEMPKLHGANAQSTCLAASAGCWHIGLLAHQCDSRISAASRQIPLLCSIPGATIGPATQTISLAAQSLVSDVELTVFPAVFTSNAGAAAGMLLLQTLGIGNYNIFGSVVTTCSITPAWMTGPSGEMVHDVKARALAANLVNLLVRDITC